MINNVISLNRYKEKKSLQNQLDMARAADELIKMAYEKGVCEHCGSFLDNINHQQPCPLKK